MKDLDNQDWAKALPYLTKAEANLTDSENLVVDRMNLAIAYLNLNEGKKAIAPLQKVLASKNLPEQARQQAEAMLADAQK